MMFGAAGSRFSFGVFVKPMTEEFEWSRSSLSGSLAIAGLATAFLRPVAGYLSDRYDPVKMALLGMLMAGAALFGLSRIDHIWQLYALFLLMGSGFTLASPATMTKLISSVFTRRRGLALSLSGSGSAIGETTLVPMAAVVVTLSGWRDAYLLLGIVLVAVIIPISYKLLKTKAEPEVDDRSPDELIAGKSSADGSVCMWMPDDGMSLKQAAKTPIFWALVFGFFT